MALINFMGGIGAAADGYNKGAREQRADNRQVEVDAYDAKVRDAETALIPLKAQAAQAATEEQISNAADRKALGPIQQKTKMELAQGDADLAAGKVDAAKKKQTTDAADEVFRVSEEVFKRQKNAEVAQEEIRAGIGQRLLDGDTDSATAMLRSAYASPTLFPAISGKSPPVSSAVGLVPAGAMDISGKPISGKALVMKMEDGTTQYLPTTFFAAAMQRRQLALEKADAVQLKAGEGVFSRNTGKQLALNDIDRVEDENGNLVKPPGRGVGSSAGQGKAGLKDSFTAALDTILTKSSEKLTPDQVNRAQVYLRKAVDQGAVTNPEEAALVASDAALHPEKITQKLNLQTGTWDEYYRDPKIAGGKNILISPNSGNFADVAKVMSQSSVRDNAGRLLGAMGTQAQQDQFLRAAHDPEYRTLMLAAATAQGADVPTLVRKLEILRTLPAPAAAAKSKTAGAGVTPSQSAVNLSPEEVAQNTARGVEMLRRTGFGAVASTASRTQATEAAQAKLAAEAPAQAQALLNGKDDEALYKFQASAAFDTLPKTLKAAIYNRVNNNAGK